MKIYYTNKLIFWNNESSDFLEKNQFDEYLKDEDWIQLSNVKSINWESHYSASFYASDNFEATYFKIVKNNKVYYFFIDDIAFDGINGRQFTLSLDLYNTYSIQLIEKLKEENPNVYFSRKHENRYYSDSNGKYIDFVNQQYIFTPPSYLGDFQNQKVCLEKHLVSLKTIGNHQPSIIIGSDTYTINDSEYVTKNKTYLYGRIKITPRIGDSIITDIKFSPIVYIPIKVNLNDSSPNSYLRFIKYPADYIIDLVILPVPPSSFFYMGKVKELYGSVTSTESNTFQNDETICLLQNLFNEGFIDTQLENPLMFSSFNTILNNDTYNIETINNEPMLYSKIFFDLMLFDKSITYPSFFYNENGKAYIKDVGLNNIKYFAHSTFYLYIDNGLNGIIYEPNSSFTCETKLPIICDVYNTYLNNNANSMNTSLQLANELHSIQASSNAASLAVNTISSTITTGLGAGTAALTGGKFGLDAVGGGISGLISSPIDYWFNSKLNDFSLKKTYAQQDALKADLKNQIGDLKDTYAKGSMLKSIYIYINSLPTYIKKKIFSDIYFNGYIVESVFKFNKYDNRINFNYFELKNVFALCSQYLKLPKNIMTSISNQLEKGIRLWKTSNFDYTMTLDNKEKSYDIEG